jgi:hypothetical protein
LVLVGFVPVNLSSLEGELGFSGTNPITAESELRFTGTNPTKTEDELRFSGTNPTKTEERTQVLWKLSSLLGFSGVRSRKPEFTPWF